MKITVRTKGHYDFVDITDRVAAVIDQSGITEGMAVVFVPGSTAALTTMEYEDGSSSSISTSVPDSAT